MAKTFINLGTCHFHKDQDWHTTSVNLYTAAKEILEEIHGKTSNIRIAHLLVNYPYPTLAEIYVDHLPSSENLEEARQDLKKAIKLAPEQLSNYSLLFRVIYTYIREKARSSDPVIPSDWLDDLAAYQDWFSILSKGDVQAKLFLGDYYLEHPQGADYKRAEAAYREAWIMDSQNPGCAIKLAQLFCCKNDTAAAGIWQQTASELLLALLDQAGQGRIKDEGLLNQSIINVLQGRLDILKLHIDEAGNDFMATLEWINAEEDFLADEIISRYDKFAQHEFYKSFRSALRQARDSRAVAGLVDCINDLKRRNKFYFRQIKKTLGERRAAFIEQIAEEYSRRLEEAGGEDPEDEILEDVSTDIENFLRNTCNPESLEDGDALEKAHAAELQALAQRMGEDLLGHLAGRQVRLLCHSLHLMHLTDEDDTDYSLCAVGFAKVLEELLLQWTFSPYRRKYRKSILSNKEAEFTDFRDNPGLEEKIKKRLSVFLKYIEGCANLMYGNMAGLVGDISLRFDMAALTRHCREFIDRQFKDANLVFTSETFDFPALREKQAFQDIETVLTRIGHLRNSAAHGAVRHEKGFTKDKNDQLIELAIGSPLNRGLIPLMIMAYYGLQDDRSESERHA